MNCYSPKEISEISIQKGTEKANLSKLNVCYRFLRRGLYCIRVSCLYSSHWYDAKRMGRFSHINRCIRIPNWTYMYFTRRWRITYREYDGCEYCLLCKEGIICQLITNWLLIAVSNFLGALFIAYFFGHFVGLTEGAF